MKRARVLVVDDKENILRLLARLLGDAYEVTTAAGGGRALSLIATKEFDVILTDLRMSGADGFEVLRAAMARAPDTEVIMMTAYASVHDAEAMKQGAYSYLQKPFDPDEAALVIARALEHRTLRGQAQTERDRVSPDYVTVQAARARGNVTHAAGQAGMERESDDSRQVSARRVLEDHSL